MTKMRFTDMLPGGYHLPANRKLLLQMGCTDVIGNGPRNRGNSEIWEYADILMEKMQVENDGLRFEVLEDAPNAEKIFWNLPGRDEHVVVVAVLGPEAPRRALEAQPPQHLVAGVGAAVP